VTPNVVQLRTANRLRAANSERWFPVYHSPADAAVTAFRLDSTHQTDARNSPWRRSAGHLYAPGVEVTVTYTPYA
jgi:hypothetical protein